MVSKLLFNERTSNDLLKLSIKEILTFTIDDVKSIYQDTFGTTGISTFNADTVLYDRVLPNFSISDELNIVGTAASVANRSFAGVGINTMLLFHIIKVIIKTLHLIKFLIFLMMGKY